MAWLGFLLFAAMVWVFGVAMSDQFKGKDNEHNRTALWVTVTIIIMLGFLFIAGALK